MDISTLFKASVKTVSLRNKALNDSFSDSSKFIVKKRSKQNKQQSLFVSKVQSVVNQISKLRELLLEKRAAYLNLSQHLVGSGKARMSDAERDEIDVGAQHIIRICSQLIKELKREVVISGEEVSQQNAEHREIMLLLMESYLKNVCKIYSEQRAIRLKRAMETRKMGKLQVEHKESEKQVKEKKSSVDLNESSSLKIQELNGDIVGGSSSNNSGSMLYEEELTSEDIQLLESENEHLYNELNSLTEEVRQIESKVVYIAELQEMFTEKVLDQDKNLDRLMTTVVGSTENVKEANEQIRQAIQRNAGLRVWILFFLLVMSFSLLFLDWYNP